jgi:hypothetical protein
MNYYIEYECKYLTFINEFLSILIMEKKRRRYFILPAFYPHPFRFRSKTIFICQ